MAEPVFTGPFKKEMQDFISLKHSVGYKYNTEPGILKRFDTYLAVKYPKTDTLSKEAVTGWCSKTMHETAANHCSRASVVRQFSKYLGSIGINAWILPKNYYPSGQQYVPHIYTPDELRRFFAETDKCHYCSEVPYRHLVMPEFFRMLLSCGLRCSEARLLTVGDVGLDQGVLTIRDSKNHNSRLVPMPESMTLRLQKYAKEVHLFTEPERYLFPGYGGKPMTVGNVYKNFRRFLWKAGISHTGDGPRVHDLRHAYCVYRLKEWAEHDQDLMVLIPMMRTYLGHQTFNETAYYLRWTADVFPDIRVKLEKCLGDIIPQMEDFSHETD
ncbi:tyrosine-type recombinase/integrase [Candidatus Formimonas warabiya]|uniref:Integrase n=1 Tax=Formimonas warabiya TaxID=1761012 RepID=A0A3G1KTL6_FORW1|nr:tyrosine-type recombinase/integrase [Candidatus Formimonas warabiya]ATW25808.1 integrase [Candidatus Formimonas warabiya]